MTTFYQLDFNIINQENNYLYKHFTLSTDFGDLTVLITVKQNIKTDNNSNEFYNTIKEVFFKVEGFNYNLYQQCLDSNTYIDLYENLGDDVYKISELFATIDLTRVETEKIFTIFFFVNDNLIT